MKQATVHGKSPRQDASLSQHRPVAGPNGIAIAPPAYGIDFVDQQRSTDERMPIQRRAREAAHLPERRQENRTGLPDHLKTGIESLSGLSLDDVHVHYNSTKPATLQALAYTQGTDIHVAPGQEKHLSHEAWHVVQQAQGRVKPTMQAKGVSINGDAALEREADVMGAQALRMTPIDQGTTRSASLQRGQIDASAVPVPHHNTSATGTVISGAMVQGKNLDQTKWVGGLEKEKEKRMAVGEGRNVNVYMDKSSIQAANKLDAFQKLAARNASIGKTVDEKAEEVWGITESNAKWTGRTSRLDDDSNPRIDPFFYEGIAKWGDKSQADEKYLGFLFQHAAGFTGYVESILDTSSPGASGVPSMYIEETESRLKGTELGDRNLKFSNIHDQTDDSNLLTLSEKGGEEKNLDAYTKIAGEGARWQCVRNHASKLKNNSRFFTVGPTKGKALAVTFTYLWLQWKEVFDKKYDIADDKVVEKLKSTTLGREVWFDELTDSDYDLDFSRGFETPFNCLNSRADFFYTPDQHPRKVLYVSRRDLWHNWISVFKGQYRITDHDVADAIWKNRIKSEWLWKDKLTPADYNLGT